MRQSIGCCPRFYVSVLTNDIGALVLYDNLLQSTNEMLMLMRDTHTWLEGGDGKSNNPGTTPPSGTIQLAGVLGTTPLICWRGASPKASGGE